MAVNFYDVAYDLENALRGSEEFTRLKNLYDEVNADESAKRMFENFRDVQLRLQQKQMMTLASCFYKINCVLNSYFLIPI